VMPESGARAALRCRVRGKFGVICLLVALSA